jgi:hypothetical protein
MEASQIFSFDNLKAAVISHKKCVVRLNDSYADMGKHYAVAIEPARPYKPQDKSKVELGVSILRSFALNLYQIYFNKYKDEKILSKSAKTTMANIKNYCRHSDELVLSLLEQ